MSKYDKLGAFLLLEKIEEDKLSKTFLAGHVVNNQIQEINFVKKFDHSLSGSSDFVSAMNQELEILKNLSNPSIVKPTRFVHEKSAFGACFDYLEGKTLRTVLQKCAEEGYPFTVEHSLLIASRICTALEYLHSKKVDDNRLIHALISPETTFVSYDGETKLIYLGLAHTLLKFPAGRDKFFHDYKNYLAPELQSQQKLDRSVDIFGTGVVLYEMLTGEPLLAKGREGSIQQSIDQAHMYNNSGERIAVPEEVKKILSQALAVDPAQRYAAIGDMRKALDEWLYSSEFSPTTFNLAFFMHSLFRENIDEENKKITDYKKMDISAHIKEEPPRQEHPVGAEAARDIPVTPIGMKQSSTPAFGQTDVFASGEPKEKSKTPVIVGALVGVAVLGLVGMLIFKPKEQAPVATPQAAGLTVEQQQAAEVERQKLQDEAVKAQEEAKKKDQELTDLKAKLDQLLKAQQQQQQEKQKAAQDTAAIQQLQEQARRLEEEKKRQEALASAKLQAAQQAANVPPPVTTPVQQASATDDNPPQEEDAKPTQLASSTPVATQQQNTPAPQPQQQDVQQAQQQKPQVTPPVQPTQSPAPAVSAVTEGQVVELSPDVVKPELVNRVNPTYPPAALKMKSEGTVILNVLVSEKGDVSDIKVLRSAAGFDEAAKTAVRKWKFRPAVKDGKRVKVWMTYPIRFKLAG